MIEKKTSYNNNNLNIILFSNQRKYLKKINIIFFFIITIYIGAILYLSDFLSKNNIFKNLYFSAGIIIMLSYLITGYKWLCTRQIMFNFEKKWFFIMSILGFTMPFFRFIVIIDLKYLFFPLFLYLLMILFHNIWKIRIINNKKKWYRKYIAIFNLGYFEFLLLLSYIIFISKVQITKSLIIFGIFLVLINFILFILNIIWRNNANKYNIPSNSSRMIIISFIFGIFLWSIKVFSLNFKIGLLSGVIAIFQIMIIIWVLIILFKGKHDFDKNYVKFYILNFAFFIEIILTIGVASTISQMQIYDDNSHINILLLMASAISFYSVLIFKNILRNNRYNNFDMSTLSILSISMLSFALLEHANLFKALSKFNIDSGILSLAAIFNGFNILFITIEWFGFSKKNERVKTWI